MSISVAMFSMAAAWKLSSRRDCRSQKGSRCVSTLTMKEHDAVKEPAGKTKRVVRQVADLILVGPEESCITGTSLIIENRQTVDGRAPLPQQTAAGTPQRLLRHGLPLPQQLAVWRRDAFWQSEPKSQNKPSRCTGPEDAFEF